MQKSQNKRPLSAISYNSKQKQQSIVQKQTQISESQKEQQTNQKSTASTQNTFSDELQQRIQTIQGQQSFYFLQQSLNLAISQLQDAKQIENSLIILQQVADDIQILLKTEEQSQIFQKIIKQINFAAIDHLNNQEIECCEKMLEFALNLFLQNNNKKQYQDIYCLTLNNKGCFYLRQGMIPEAFKQFQQALKTLPMDVKNYYQGLSYMNIASIYIQQNELEEALAFQKISIENMQSEFPFLFIAPNQWDKNIKQQNYQIDQEKQIQMKTIVFNLVNFSFLQDQLSNSVEAIQNLKLAYSICFANFGSEHQLTRQIEAKYDKLKTNHFSSRMNKVKGLQIKPLGSQQVIPKIKTEFIIENIKSTSKDKMRKKKKIHKIEDPIYYNFLVGPYSQKSRENDKQNQFDFNQNNRVGTNNEQFSESKKSIYTVKSENFYPLMQSNSNYLDYQKNYFLNKQQSDAFNNQQTSLQSLNLITNNHNKSSLRVKSNLFERNNSQNTNSLTNQQRQSQQIQQQQKQQYIYGIENDIIQNLEQLLDNKSQQSIQLSVNTQLNSQEPQKKLLIYEDQIEILLLQQNNPYIYSPSEISRGFIKKNVLSDVKFYYYVNSQILVASVYFEVDEKEDLLLQVSEKEEYDNINNSSNENNIQQRQKQQKKIQLIHKFYCPNVFNIFSNEINNISGENELKMGFLLHFCHIISKCLLILDSSKLSISFQNEINEISSLKKLNEKSYIINFNEINEKIHIILNNLEISTIQNAENKLQSISKKLI